MTSTGVETLTHLVASMLTEAGGRDTLDTLTERCIDPESGYHPSRNTVWKLSRPDLAFSVKINPELVRAVAAGVGVDQQRAQAAAAFQFTGYVIDTFGADGVARESTADSGIGPKSKAAFERWDKEESDIEGNHSA